MSRWLVRLGERPAPRARLVCFPYAGGNAGVFRSWSARLPDDLELLAVRLPAREARFAEPPCANWDALVEDLSAEVRALLDLPLVLFGHSFGAMLAFEIARDFERRGCAGNASLVVSACAAPGQAVRSAAPVDGPSAELWAWVRALDATPREIVDDEGMRALLEPALRADLCLAREWRERHPQGIEMPIVGLRGLDDPLVSRSDMEAWGACTTGGYRGIEFAGGHFFIHERQAEVAGVLAGAWAAA